MSDFSFRFFFYFPLDSDLDSESRSTKFLNPDPIGIRNPGINGVVGFKKRRDQILRCLLEPTW
jgi:hypothetical protein